MYFRSYPGTRKEVDLLVSIAPIFRIDLQTGKAHLVGTGFWVSESGHLITARHVIQENIGPDGVDRGPIFAIQTFTDRSCVARSFSTSDIHPVFDLALSETVIGSPYSDRPTVPRTMSLDELGVDDQVFSFAVLAHDQNFENEKIGGQTSHIYHGTIATEWLAEQAEIRFAVRLSMGAVTNIFEKMRDRVMLPFPCIQTDVPIYGGNSGGPLFDVRGRIAAVHCTSFGANDIAFHVPIQGILNLTARTQSLGISGPSKLISVLEMALSQKIMFEPPMLNAHKLWWSLIRWVGYAAKCVLRREKPSINFHFATEKSFSDRGHTASERSE